MSINSDWETTMEPIENPHVMQSAWTAYGFRPKRKLGGSLQCEGTGITHLVKLHGAQDASAAHSISLPKLMPSPSHYRAAAGSPENERARRKETSPVYRSGGV